MKRSAQWRTHLIVATLAIVAGTAVLAYITGAPLRSAKINDFYSEAWPAYIALAHGHLVGFVQLAPAYAGSLVLRAPFTLVPFIWGGGPRELYFASALPCMMALAVFVTWLAAQPRRRGISWASRISPLVFLAFNPLILITLYDGHPEEILGAVLCVGAVVFAVNGRAGWAGLLLGLAVINKSWALVAIPVVLVVMPCDRRRALLIAAATAGAVLIPILAVPGSGARAVGGGAQIGTTFTPPQLLWWFGSHSWIVQQARPVIGLVAFACAGLWWGARGRAGRSRSSMADALLLLALVLLLRAALDPWNNLYYHVPFLLALMAYEVRSGRMPLMSVVASFALLAIVPIRGIPHMSFDLRAATYALVVVPTIGWMVARLCLPARVSSASWSKSRRRLQRRWHAEEVTAA